MKYCHECTDTCTKSKHAGAPVPDPWLQAVQPIAQLLTQVGLVCVDLSDLKSVLSDGGMAVMGVGEASGPDRARFAADAAILDLKSQLAGLKIRLPQTNATASSGG
jgi:hypothetical protein